MTIESLAAKEPSCAADWSDAVVRFCGGLSAVLGLIVLVGWYTHTLALLQIVPTFVAMAYNTALGFFLCGLGLAAVHASRTSLLRRVTLLGGVFGTAIGSLTAGEYLFGFNFGIDELLMKAYVRSGITAPGRMAICTALCFFLIGSALLMIQGRRFPLRPLLLALIGALVFGFGMVALSGYSTGIDLSYAWGQLTRMAVHTATGFLVLGLGVIALSYKEERACLEERLAQNAEPRRLPILAVLVGVGGIATTLCLWQALVVEESAQIDLLQHLTTQNPTIASLSRAQALLPLGELICGLVLSALLAWAVALAQTARWQAEELRVVRDGLEQRVQERTEDLAHVNRSLEEMAGWQRGFLRDVLASVTEGKLQLCDHREDLPLPSSAAWGQPISLTPQSGLRTLRGVTLEVAEACQLADIRIHDLVTAVNEAGMNAIVHAGMGTAQIFYSTGLVQVWVEDCGKGITMENLPRATLSRGFTTAGTLGHGLKMMLQTTDRLWLLTGPTGTTVVLEQESLSPEPLWANG